MGFPEQAVAGIRGVRPVRQAAGAFATRPQVRLLPHTLPTEGPYPPRPLPDQVLTQTSATLQS